MSQALIHRMPLAAADEDDLCSPAPRCLPANLPGSKRCHHRPVMLWTVMMRLCLAADSSARLRLAYLTDAHLPKSITSSRVFSKILRFQLMPACAAFSQARPPDTPLTPGACPARHQALPHRLHRRGHFVPEASTTACSAPLCLRTCATCAPLASVARLSPAALHAVQLAFSTDSRHARPSRPPVVPLRCQRAGLLTYLQVERPFHAARR